MSKLPESWKAPNTLPKNIGACIDLLVSAKQRRKEIEAEAALVGKQEKLIEAHLLEQFTREQLNGAKGKLASVSVSEKDTPHVDDKEAFGKFVAATKSWDMLYGRAVEEACQSRWEAGEEIPGVSKFHVKKLSLTEVKVK